MPALLPVVRERLARNLRIRRNLPGEGTLRIDRQLPFLCIHRRPDGEPDPGTHELVTTEAAYLLASGAPQHASGVADLCRMISDTLREHFGVLLFLEIWAADLGPSETELAEVKRPMFQIVASEAEEVPTTLAAFESSLQTISIGGLSADVTVVRRSPVAPPGLPALSPCPPGDPATCVCLGLAVRPIYRDAEGGVLYPLVLQRLRTQLSRALRRAIFSFSGVDSADPQAHFDALGPSALSRTARLADQQICEVSEAFDFLLQATPVNSEQAWHEFSAEGFKSQPTLYYRPLPYHPTLLKRRLYEIPIERIEDPTLAHLFWLKQEELDRQLTALRDRGTPNFLYGSLQLYGEPDDVLVGLARQVLAVDAPSAADGDGDLAGVAETAARAREEIDIYHSRQASFSARVEVCDDIAAGLMVAKDELLVSETVGIPRRRLQPLLHHEVGTHLLTYFNGREQPLRQMYAGLSGADGLQEGLAVLAEYFTGGLTPDRLRTLAARVVTVRSMTDGRPFEETFQMLRDEHRLAARAAFVTTLRVYRSGGLTKDIIYLRGLCDLLAYLRQGHELEPLFVGKIALEHLPFVQELRRRGIIRPPPLLPRFWEEGGFRDRLERVRRCSVLDLLEDSP